MHRRNILLTALLVLVMALAALPAHAQFHPMAAATSVAPSDTAPGGTRSPSIAISPAVVMVKAKPGQTFSQELTIWNNTPIDLAFVMEARDVLVRDGKRVYLPGGDVSGSIARNAVFSSYNIEARAGSFASTRITVTLPQSPEPRAIACIFQGKTAMQTRNALALTGSLGALVTFTLADDFQVKSQPLQVVTDAELKSISFHQALTNTGTDPVVPNGVIAVLNQDGVLVTRLALRSQRLLPGETAEFSVEHAGFFKAGKYRALFLLENEKAFFSNSADFTLK